MAGPSAQSECALGRRSNPRARRASPSPPRRTGFHAHLRAEAPAPFGRGQAFTLTYERKPPAPSVGGGRGGTRPDARLLAYRPGAAHWSTFRPLTSFGDPPESPTCGAGMLLWQTDPRRAGRGR